MKEVELKLLVDPRTLPALRRRIGALGGSKPRTRKLRTIYLDTAEAGLARAGHALRLRVEGRRWTQTVKTAREMDAGLSKNDETNTPAPGGRIDLAALPAAVREAIERAAAGLPLAPVYETVVTRSTWHLMHDGAEIEIALDRGEIIAGERREALDELEIELLDGAPATLFDIARRLFPTGPVRFSTRNKAARARALAEGGQAVEPAVPVNAQIAAIDPGAPAETAARAILTECFRQISGNVTAVLASDDIEGPHQLRVGLRRLRSALQLLAPVLSNGEGDRRYEALHQEARWLGQEVGRLRDLDVAGADLLAPAAAAAPHEPGFRTLVHAVEERAVEERRGLRETLTGARATAFLFELAEYVALRGWLDPADHGQTERLAKPFLQVADAAAAKAYRKAAKRARHIETLDHEARHDLRKALKALRYIIEFGSPCWPEKKLRPMLKALKSLQTLFGELNDAAMAEALFLSEDAPAAGQPCAARAAGRLIGGSERAADHAWEAAKARWKAFSGASRPWQ